MRQLKFYIDTVENPVGPDYRAWHCTDGISCYWGETQAEAASHYGVPIGDYDDAADIAALGPDNKYPR